jgi:D-alanyl-D-alanine carboxypeptidase (penicillin-binding protein 5/6)
MDAAFTQFRIYDLHTAGEEMAQLDVYLGKSDTVGVALAAPVRAGMHVSDRKGVSSQITYKTVTAPVSRGDVVGTLSLSVPGREARTFDVIATEDVERLGLLARAWTGLLAKIRGES